MLQLCVCRDIEHLGSLESTQEARVALGNSYASFVLSKLPACSMSRHTHELIVNLRIYLVARLCVLLLIRPSPYFFFRLASNAFPDIGSVGRIVKKKKLKTKDHKNSWIRRPWYLRMTLKVNIYIFGLTKCTIIL